jgi:hypothetical protein
MHSLRRLLTLTHLLVVLTGLFLCTGFSPLFSSTAEAATPDLQETPTPTPTATPSPTPNATLEELDNRIKELEKRATIAQKEKEIAENEALLATAEKNKIVNLLPSPTATPLAGTTTFEGQVSFQNELLAYKSLADIATSVGTDMDGLSGSVVIYNDADINALQSYSIMLAQIKTIVDRYKILNQEIHPGAAEEVGGAAIFAAPQVASTLLRSVADVAALFRTNTVTTGVSITPDETVLNAEIAAALRKKGLKVYEPKLYLPNLFGQSDSELIKQLGNLNQLKTRAEQSVAEFDALTEDELKDKLKANIKKTTIPKLKALNTQVDTFINNLLRIDETTKLSPLVGLYRAEKMKSLLDNTPCFILQLKLAKAEGNRTTKSNLFTGTKTSYTGGMILAYTLFDRDGQIIKSGIHATSRGSSNSRIQEDVLTKLP